MILFFKHYLFVLFVLVSIPFITAGTSDSPGICDVDFLDCPNAGHPCDDQTECYLSQCVDGVCLPHNFGSQCFRDADCWSYLPGDPPICYGDICSPLVFPGDSCSTSAGGPLCANGNDHCISGRCTALWTGDVCTASWQCGAEGYCADYFANNYHCAILPTLGEPCFSSSRCADGYVCMERCTYRRNLGQPCSLYITYSCEPGLYCSYSDTLCHENPPSVLKYCDENTSDCECTCKPGDPTPVCPTITEDAFWSMIRSNALDVCASDHSCTATYDMNRYTGFPVVPGSCLYEHCLPEFIDYLSNYCHVLSIYWLDTCYASLSFYFGGIYRCTSNGVFLPPGLPTNRSSTSSSTTLHTSSLLPSSTQSSTSSTQLSTSSTQSSTSSTQLSTSSTQLSTSSTQLSTSSTRLSMSTRYSTSTASTCPTPLCECTDHWFWYFMIFLVIEIILLAGAWMLYYFKCRTSSQTIPFEVIERESSE